MDRIADINRVIAGWFAAHPTEHKVAAKDLMGEFVKAGIFPADRRNGLPIRNVLRRLDSEGQLQRIPYVQAERKAANTNWFFIRTDRPLPQESRPVSTPKQPMTPMQLKATGSNRDEHYVIDLCDEILGRKASRQHRFPFVLGDLHRNGTGRTALPCDAYYPTLQLVVEFNERQHTEAVNHFDKPHQMTVSGMHRGEQRALYEQRKRETLPKHGIRLVEVGYSDFVHDSGKRILRNPDRDRQRLASLLKEFLPSKDQ